MRKKDAESAIANKVENIHAKGLLPAQWDQKDLRTMVSWFKRPGDKAFPSTKIQLLHRYFHTCNRCEQEHTRLKQGEQPVLDDDDDETLDLGSGGGSKGNGTPNLGSGRGNGVPDLGSGGGNVTPDLSSGEDGGGTAVEANNGGALRVKMCLSRILCTIQIYLRTVTGQTKILT
jgi:hypothetical protein